MRISVAGDDATDCRSHRGQLGYKRATFVQQGRGARRAGSGRRRSDELQPVEPEPGAQLRWVKPLSCYERRETTVVEGLRYG